MRLSLALILPCAVSTIALPVIAGEADAVANTKPETTLGHHNEAGAIEEKRGYSPLPKSRNRGEHLSWTSPEGRWCEAKVGTHGTIHIKRKHGHGHPNDAERAMVKDCLVGLNKLAENNVLVANLMDITNHHYDYDWDWGNDKRSVEDVEHVADVEATESEQEAQGIQGAQGKPMHLGGWGWMTNKGRQCTGEVINGTVFITREHGPGHPNKHDKAKVMECLAALYTWSKTDDDVRRMMTRTIMHYTQPWGEHDDGDDEPDRDVGRKDQFDNYRGELVWRSPKDERCTGHVGKHAILIDHEGKHGQATVLDCLNGLESWAKTHGHLRSLLSGTEKQYAKYLGRKSEGMEKRVVEDVENVEEVADVEHVEDVEATESEQHADDLQTAEAKGEFLFWAGKSGALCKGWLKKDGIIHVERQHGFWQPTRKTALKVKDCIDGLEDEAERKPQIKAYMPTTMDYYYNRWGSKRSVADAGVVESKEGVQDLQDDHHVSNPDILRKRSVEAIESEQEAQDTQDVEGHD